jgi:DNA-binding MarR family transcriptional regulator
LAAHRTAQLSARRRELLDALATAGRESSTATVMFHTAIAEKAGLTASDVKTMDILARMGPLTAGDLSTQTGLATASVTSLIDRLEAKKLVRRVRDPKDRRRVIVEPAPGRLAAGDSFFGPIQKAFEALMEDYSDEQLSLLLDFLKRTTDRTREITASIASGAAKTGAAPRTSRRKPKKRTP